MTDQFAPQPANADPQNLTGATGGFVPSNVVTIGDQPAAQSSPQPPAPVSETHSTVTVDGVERGLAEALTMLGARNGIVQQIEAYVHTYGLEAAERLHGIVERVANTAPPAS